MKNLAFLLLAFLLIAVGCKKVDQFSKFNLEYNKSIEIPAITGIGLPAGMPIPDVETNYELSLPGTKTDIGLIETVTMEQAKLTINTPVDGDFSFLKSITIYMKAKDLDEVKVAWQNSVPDTIGNILDLETSDTDLSAYMMKDSFDLRVNTVIRKVITEKQQIDLYTKFLVDVKILGQ